MKTNRTDIQEILKEIREILPSQGPIDVFIHHNTLHAFEEFHFEEAVEKAAEIYSAEAYMSEVFYQAQYAKGRITDKDLERILAREPSYEQDLNLYKELLLTAPDVESFQQVKWLLRERRDKIGVLRVSLDQARSWLNSERLKKQVITFQHINLQAANGLSEVANAARISEVPEEAGLLALWSACLLAIAEVSSEVYLGLKEVNNWNKSDDLVNSLLIRFCGEYLDRGLSDSSMPNRDGLIPAFKLLVDSSKIGLPNWLRHLKREYLDSNKTSEDKILDLCAEFAVSAEDRQQFLIDQAISLKGWAGLISFVETNSLASNTKPQLADYMMLRLLLKLAADSYLKLPADLPRNNDLNLLNQIYCSAYHLLHLLVSLKVEQKFLNNKKFSQTLAADILHFHQIKRRRIWHLAYERNLYNRTCVALLSHKPKKSNLAKAQVVFCIDDREESLRRYLEYIQPSVQTFGTAGFFGVDAKYQSLSGNLAAHCPVVIKPSHTVREIPRPGREGELSRYRLIQKYWFKLGAYVDRESGSVLHGWLLSIMGVLSLFPMLLGILAPRFMRPFSDLLGLEGQVPSELAELKIDAVENEEGGYTIDEMADRVVSVLRGIGLVENFADYVVLLSHGSSSRNNPLRSAYDCGACGGRPGRMNSRAFALMANRQEVREQILDRYQIKIPKKTFFVGAFHNTCSDEIEYFDLEQNTASLNQDFFELKNNLKQACKFNAFERCRRFAQSDVKTPEQAVEEVQARSYILSEARPEYGHATNALCIVGPRELTRGLFLDRRAFLVSYDNQIDSDGSILLGILRAVVPVCGGINLEYLFSAVDNEVYGAGTKLPHNIVSLVGLMNGTCSDLRTGLPLQMVEIHEPVRLFLVLACTRRFLDNVIAKDPNIKRAFDGNWLNVAVWEEDQIFSRSQHGYEEVKLDSNTSITVENFTEWVTGKTDHLAFVSLEREI